MKYTAWEYQKYATDRMIEASCGPLLEMGLGKTVSALTAMDELIKAGEVKKVLIISPLRVADIVWSNEIEKWDHLKHLKYSKVLGSEAKRKKALLVKADIYLINRENVPWLVAFYAGAWPFDATILDESSSFKDPTSKRFKAIRQVAPRMKRKYILTGTPIPNGMLDLWSQIYFLDKGQRLGESYAKYREKYFEPDKRNREVIHSYKIRNPDADLLGPDIMVKEIQQKIGDICFSMKARDYLDMPPRLDTITWVKLSAADKERYDVFERDSVLAMGEEEITALSAGALYNKLLQFANGAVYDDDHKFHEMHNAKIEALRERLEAANGHPVLVPYQFQHDRDRIVTYLKEFKPVVFKTEDQYHAWNRKEIPLLIAHPLSFSHGLNMQDGGHLLEWFGRPWSAEAYTQTVGRLDRQGQKFTVINNTIAVMGTIEEQVLSRNEGKLSRQAVMMDAVKAIVRKHR
jgi:SNF2 family DNA or RNA helicase